jgi:hypothetical protein
MPAKSTNDATSGQPRRASDSRPRPGSGTPSSDRSETSDAKVGIPPKGDPKPSSSPSALDPGRKVKGEP